MLTNLFKMKEKLPIIFTSDYNVTFCGLQCLYPYDTEKGQHILNYLKMGQWLTDDKIIKTTEIWEDELLEIHSERYLDSLRLSDVVSRIAEIPLVHYVPNIFVQHSYLKPMRFQVKGTLIAVKSALKEGWAINLGGGFSHASSDEGGSFSPYADVSLALKWLLASDTCSKVMVIDLSARQGNGYARDFMDVKSVYILDMYNSAIYPQDDYAKIAIARKIELQPKAEDEVYLRKLRINLTKAFKEFRPNLIIYIAGTDILNGDPLGGLSISPEGIVQRDEIVFTKAKSENCPVAVLLGVGYTKQSAQVFTTSILNLKKKGLLPSKHWAK